METTSVKSKIVRQIQHMVRHAVIEATQKASEASLGTGEAYDAYKGFCDRIGLGPLTGRAFGDLLNELDMYSLVRTRVLSRGRYGRSREITLDLPETLVERLHTTILLNFELGT